MIKNNLSSNDVFQLPVNSEDILNDNDDKVMKHKDGRAVNPNKRQNSAERPDQVLRLSEKNERKLRKLQKNKFKNLIKCVRSIDKKERKTVCE